ncbi:putative 3-hydroxybutyryl-CoA dehydrogenase [Rhodococcoides trifolii]|uniref:3-hydroxybutyryl-CoA dehydrogenase n=1 Tax=Rhodococcoides trifolii TaxID=908250 RepID=A0A917CT62_9NOCA|nr:3-hydroxybutyryl-CoA dehydrogenase [Rhodococcus trifolii]GGF95294.1 putative 3-hydroxybutyryl-CoA dehydrogenase [Rhodococcus trifolii]
MTVERVGVVGAGEMGAGIAEVCALARVDVLVYEPTRELGQLARTRVLSSLDRAVSSGKVTEREREQSLSRLRFTTDLADFRDRQLVVEAAVEDERIKEEIFAELDAVVVDCGAVLASSTSSIPIETLACAAAAPERVLGMHFFNPVPVLPLVELVTTRATGPDVVARADAFASDVLGKQVVHSSDRSGYVVNALLVPYLLSAIRMLESGFASKTDIDRATVLGLTHPVGPLALTDLMGLDTVKAIAERMHDEFGEPLYRPPLLLVQMVDAGRLGKKTGEGFYAYR